jgi:DNA-binding IclR family transcriptional regulator
VPATLAEAHAVLEEVRERGAARVVDTLLPGIVGFCVPVFDSDGHIVLGIVALGPVGTFDPEWEGAVDRPLRAAARQLSSDLGYRG